MKLKITLTKSTIGQLKPLKNTVRALGLNKMNSSSILPDNAAIRGMINTVKHLVTVEDVKGE